MTRRTSDPRVFRKATEAKRQARGEQHAAHVVTSRLLPVGCRDLGALEAFHEIRFPPVENDEGRWVRSEVEADLNEDDLYRWFFLVESTFTEEYVSADWLTPLRSCVIL